MKKVIVLIFIFLSVNAYAGMSGGRSAYYSSSNVSVNSYIDVDADSVVMPISISCSAKTPAKRAKLMTGLLSLIKSEVSKTQHIEFVQGGISLSPKSKKSFSISSSYSSSSSDIYLFCKLDKAADIYDANQKLHQFMTLIKTPDDVSISLGNTILALRSAEKYREELLNKIKAEIDTVKNIFGASYKVSITGLENSVTVRQKDDKQVTLFIDYKLVFNE